MVEADEAAIDGVYSDSLRELVGTICADYDASVRLVFRYEGEEYDVAYVDDAVSERFTDAELDRRVETLMMKGLGDPPHEQALHEFGRLQATVRWFDGAVVAYFPDDDWSGVIVVLDRPAPPVVELAMEHLDGSEED